MGEDDLAPAIRAKAMAEAFQVVLMMWNGLSPESFDLWLRHETERLTEEERRYA